MWRLSRKAELHVLGLAGALDGRSPAIDEAVDALCATVSRQPSLHWAVQVDTIPMLSAANLARLLALVRQVHNAGGRLTLVAPPPAVAVVLNAARLDRLLPAHPDLAAVEAG
jgi:anti-anti-sigma factor